MTDTDRNLAILFIAAAEKAAETERRGGAPFHTHESVAADFRRELEPLMRGIGALPEKDGLRFEYQDCANERKDPVYSVLTIHTAAGHHALFLRATTIVRGGLYIGLGYQENNGKTKGYHEDNGRKDFAEAREALAQWFAEYAPDRIADLKELLLPEEPPPSVTLDKALRVDGPLRFRRAGNARR